MAKQAIERTLEKAPRGLPAQTFTRGELALRGEEHRYAHTTRAAIPTRTRPTRMCLGCRERAAQSELIRVFSLHSQGESSSLSSDSRSDLPSSASSKAGHVARGAALAKDSWVIQLPHQERVRPLRLKGRSAYVHNSHSCFKKACIGQRLQRAFRETVSMERVQSLLATLEAIEVKSQGSNENTTKRNVASNKFSKVCGTSADIRGSTDTLGSRVGAGTRTEQIKREAKE